MPNVTTIMYTTSDGTQNYHSLQLTFDRRLRKGLTMSANYVWSHVLASGAGVQTLTNYGLDYGSAPLDVRHRVVAQANYELPFGSSLTRWRGALASGWQLNVVGLWETGMPFTVTNNTARGNTGGSDRPNRVCDGSLTIPRSRRGSTSHVLLLNPCMQSELPEWRSWRAPLSAISTCRCLRTSASQSRSRSNSGQRLQCDEHPELHAAQCRVGRGKLRDSERAERVWESTANPTCSEIPILRYGQTLPMREERA